MGLVFGFTRLVANGQPAQPSFKFHDMSIFAINTGDYGLVSGPGLQLKLYAKIFKFNDISLSAIKTWIRDTDTSFKEQKEKKYTESETPLKIIKIFRQANKCQAWLR